MFYCSISPVLHFGSSFLSFLKASTTHLPSTLSFALRSHLTASSDSGTSDSDGTRSTVPWRHRILATTPIRNLALEGDAGGTREAPRAAPSDRESGHSTERQHRPQGALGGQRGEETQLSRWSQSTYVSRHPGIARNVLPKVKKT